MEESKRVIWLKDNKVMEFIEKFLYSKGYLAFLAVLTLLANFFSLEFPVYIFICLLVVYISLFSRDMLPMLPIPLFMYFTPSWGNNPAVNPQSIFYPEHGLYFIVAAVLVAFAGVIVRIVLREKKDFFTAKRSLIPGFIALAITFLLGGIGTEYYIFENFRYVLLFFVSLFVFYYLFTGTIDWKCVGKDYMCQIGFTLGVVLLAELVYIFTFAKGGLFNPIGPMSDVFRDGSIVRNNIHTGWGIHNNIAGMMCVMLPFFFYFAGTRKFGFIYNLLAHLLCLGIVCTISRTSMLSAACEYVICAVVLLCRKQNRMQNAIVFGTVIGVALLAVASVFLLAQGEGKLAQIADKLIASVMNKFDQLLALGFSDSNRLSNYSTALQQFSENPLFGNAFYSCNAYQYNLVGGKMSFLPARWHNTICQVLASCGIVGLMGYFYHRVQSLRVFFKNFGFSKFFVLLSFLSILGISMLDCHLFNIGPGLIYSILLCFAEKMEKDEDDPFMDWAKNN